MSIKITPLGGMGEIGKNMTIVSLDDEKIIVDMGVNLEKILNRGNNSVREMGRRELVEMGGIPDDSKIHREKISAIILTHGHLDHIGAVGKLAHQYDAPIYATPFTAELVKRIIKEERVFDVDNEIKSVKLGDSVEIGNLEVEFIQGAHSIPQNAFPTIHYSEKVVLCVGGFKIDESPILGVPTDYSSLSNLTDSGSVISLICSVRADDPKPTPSEAEALEMLKDVMSDASDTENGMLVTTFSSHIARIKIIVEISYRSGRTPVILGRSLKKKCRIAYDLGLVDFPSELKILGHPDLIRKALGTIDKCREEYVIIMSGHQGEPNALLTKIADKKEPYKIEPGDQVIFSASVIPNPLNISNRMALEAKLEAQGASIHRDVHVSGHAGRPGTKKLIEKIGPDHIVPFHGTFEKMKSVLQIGREIGYSEDQLHLIKNNQTLSMGV